MPPARHPAVQHIEYEGCKHQGAGVIDMFRTMILDVVDGGKQGTNPTNRVSQRKPVGQVKAADHGKQLGFFR